MLQALLKLLQKSLKVRKKVDFISVVSEKAHELCLNSGKKTIMPEHVIAAMRSFNFQIDQNEINAFIEELNKMKAVFYYIVYST